MLCRPSRGGASRNKVSAADQAAAEAVAPPVGARVEIELDMRLQSRKEVAPPVGARVEISGMVAMKKKGEPSPLPWGRE